jgi:SAM-dependent methyltransferase
MKKIKNLLKNLLYPGLDLHCWSRAQLCRFWQAGPRRVLDAGSGNGFFSWLAYRSGAEVVGLNFEESQVRRTREFLEQVKQVDPERLQLQQMNLYDLDERFGRFDEIICYETIEHIRDDARVCRALFAVLKPGGVLHLCTPHAMHPRHQREVLDTEEKGGHVRPGYTEESYRKLLEPIGYRIEQVVGLGQPRLVRADAFLRRIRNRVGDAVALPLFPLAALGLLGNQLNPKVPFSLYVKAIRPG